MYIFNKDISDCSNGQLSGAPSKYGAPGNCLPCLAHCYASGHPVWVLVNHLDLQCEYLLIIWTSETCKTERFKPTAIQILIYKPHILHHTSFFPSDAPKNTSLSAFPSSSVMEGKPVTLTCRTDANPAELNYTWYRETGSQLSSCRLDIITPTSWQTLHMVHGMAVMHKTCMVNATLRFNLMFSVSTKTNLKLI